MKTFLITLLSLVALFESCNAKGAPWTEEEFKIIAEKVWLCVSGNVPNADFRKLYPDYEKPSPKVTPNFKKILRLGFHDCLTYENPADGEINGCDGCLNPTGMALDMMVDFNTDKGEFNGPNVNVTNNNGLGMTADLLEEVFTNKDFPNKAPSLAVSMKDSGKSRADLWAFASILAVMQGIKNNNDACNGKTNAVKNCGTLKAGEEGCEVHWPALPTFRTGRTDCVTPEGAEKPWHTSVEKHEFHPSPNGNGPETVDFYKKSFGLNAREAFALNAGGHSVGRFNPQVSYGAYSWTRKQEEQFNNQFARAVAQRPEYFSNCEDWVTGEKKWSLVGDAYGNKPQTSWRVVRKYITKNGGPYQWHHVYTRCPAANECATFNRIETEDRVEGETPEGCCDDLEPGMYCQPWCVKKIQNDETAVQSDMGFYFHFDRDEDGMPTGCPAFEDEKWLLGADGRKGGKSRDVDCDLETYAPDGEPLHQIVEEIADSNENLMKDFGPAMEKMIHNGYEAEAMDEIPAEWWSHVYDLQ